MRVHSASCTSADSAWACSCAWASCSQALWCSRKSPALHRRQLTASSWTQACFLLTCRTEAGGVWTSSDSHACVAGLGDSYKHIC